MIPGIRSCGPKPACWVDTSPAASDAIPKYIHSPLLPRHARGNANDSTAASVEIPSLPSR